MANKLIVSAAPHITSADSTSKIMGRVCIALLPTLIASVLIFGFQALLLTAVTVAVFSLLCGYDPIYQLLSGGLILGAFFMATDYVTSPTTEKGKLVFGIGLGVITCLIRFFGTMNEGVSFAILFMNILTPYLSKWTRSKPLGGVPA